MFPNLLCIIKQPVCSLVKLIKFHQQCISGKWFWSEDQDKEKSN